MRAHSSSRTENNKAGVERGEKWLFSVPTLLDSPVKPCVLQLTLTTRGGDTALYGVRCMGAVKDGLLWPADVVRLICGPTCLAGLSLVHALGSSSHPHFVREPVVLTHFTPELARTLRKRRGCEHDVPRPKPKKRGKTEHGCIPATRMAANANKSVCDW
ncbi:hypothetical protein, conserved [Leishmania tarentolae]|uniref:Uncharacterized protein n=1 Tax=Leishmania tarentolae TaxID=5689 RepID=A0A640KTM8_LEITA|nr:hypothetical protein, conserved [Leishmania tarentolae]